MSAFDCATNNAFFLDDRQVMSTVELLQNTVQRLSLLNRSIAKKSFR
jgi:hypothetical protein